MIFSDVNHISSSQIANFPFIVSLNVQILFLWNEFQQEYQLESVLFPAGYKLTFDFDLQIWSEQKNQFVLVLYFLSFFFMTF